MLSDVRPLIQFDEEDEATERVVALATANAGRLIRKLLVESIVCWASNNFDRYDDREISFTIRLFAWMLEVKQAHRGKMSMIHPQYDGPLPTADMLLGLANAAATPRPDLTFGIGDALIHIEAKRLMPTKGLPAKYVNEGMMRFVDGRYISPGVSFSLMLSYIMQGEPAECYEAVNGVIKVHPKLGPEHVVDQVEVADKFTVYASSHNFGNISHYAVDVRLRQPSTVVSRGVVQ